MGNQLSLQRGRTRGRRLKNSGFTLVEIMVVAALVGFLALLGIPRLLNRVPMYRLDQAARQINAHLRMARMRAMSEGRPVCVQFNNSAGSYSMWQFTGGTPSSDQLTTYHLNDRHNLSFTAYPTTPARFQPGGELRISESGLSVMWVIVRSRGATEQRTIMVWPSGQTLVYRSGG